MKKVVIFSALLFVAIGSNSCSKNEHTMFGDLHGIVSDFVTGDPISGVTVTLSPGGRNQVTGSDGRFEFRDLDPMQYTITAQRSGYQTNRRTVSVVIGESIEVNISLREN